MRISSKNALTMLMISLVMIAAVAVIGTNMQPSQAVNSATVTKADPLEKFRAERQQLRAMQKAQLNDIIHDAATEAATADLARRQLIELCEAEEQELTVEGILSMRGFSDPVVTVHKASVNVLVRTDSLNRQQSSIILDLVCRETGVSAGDVKIIPIN